MNFLDQYKNRINQLCESYDVNSLFAFGSVITDKFRPESDIDLVVDIQSLDPITYSENYFNLKFELENILKRQVDLLEMKSIRNKFLKSEIDRTKVLIYGDKSQNLA